jgi:4-diphosphocytidyl-2-C-methyl-D-erythritol kinase
MVTKAVLARAKVNLCLHVTGKRADGYHLLDSLVVFADLGDKITVTPAPDLNLVITGPQAAQLPVQPDNLVLRAARLLSGPGAHITLEKHLPVASGIGGGSADAAAALHALCALWQIPLPQPHLVLGLGADVPVCLAGIGTRMQGVGEQLHKLDQTLPQAWLVLVNPGVAVSTPAVFKGMAKHTHAPMPQTLPRMPLLGDLVAFLKDQRNDLEAPAMAIAPQIGHAKQALLAQQGCLIARMSGSGATCFGLFADARGAALGAANIKSQFQDWWVDTAAMIS